MKFSGMRARSVLAMGAGCLAAAAFPVASWADAPSGVVSADAGAVHSGNAPSSAPAAPEGAFINRPTMSMAQYKAAKAPAAHAAASDTRSDLSGAQAAAPRSITAFGGFNGTTQGGAGGTWFPPDTNGATSSSQNVTVNNSKLTVYARSISPGAPQSERSLNSVAGYSTQALFDPRIIYDATANRWIIEAEAFPESTTVQYQAIMISTSGDANGSYITYLINVTSQCGTGGFWDYPQLGQTQDALILTANCFNSSNAYTGSRVFGMSKAIVYNAKGFSTPVYTLADTATPPVVLDQNPSAYIIEATNPVAIARFSNPQAGAYGFMGAAASQSGWFTPSVPRSAGQPGCTTASCTLDTGDGRFENNSTQYGDNLINAASYGLSGNGSFATPSWGIFDVAGSGANTVKQKGQVFFDGCSDDFHVSAAGDKAGRVYLNWMTTDPQGGSCTPQFMGNELSGRTSANSAGTMPSRTLANRSSAELTGNFDSNFGQQRSGDTSSITIDPSSYAWSWQERVASSSAWGTRSNRFFVTT